MKNTGLPEHKDEGPCDQDVAKGSNVVRQIHHVLHDLRGEAVQVVVLIFYSLC